MVNNGNKRAIMDNSRGPFQGTRAVDGKLKSNLVWPEVQIMFGSSQEEVFGFFSIDIGNENHIGAV